MFPAPTGGILSVKHYAADNGLTQILNRFHFLSDGCNRRLPALLHKNDSVTSRQFPDRLRTLQEIFYAQKGACGLSDAELLVAMRRVYDELAGGDAAFLADVPPEALRRIAAGGSLRGTGLERGDG